MKMNAYQIIKLGRRYMHMWPERAELAQYFAEYRIIQFSRIVYRMFPGLALFVLIMQLYFGSIEALSQALVYTFFILSMPVQTLVMLGLQADKVLPPSLAQWYRQGVARFNEGGGAIKLSGQQPRYLDLAQLLSLTYQQAKL